MEKKENNKKKKFAAATSFNNDTTWRKGKKNVDETNEKNQGRRAWPAISKYAGRV